MEEISMAQRLGDIVFLLTLGRDRRGTVSSSTRLRQAWDRPEGVQDVRASVGADGDSLTPDLVGRGSGFRAARRKDGTSSRGSWGGEETSEKQESGRAAAGGSPGGETESGERREGRPSGSGGQWGLRLCGSDAVDSVAWYATPATHRRTESRRNARPHGPRAVAELIAETRD